MLSIFQRVYRGNLCFLFTTNDQSLTVFFANTTFFFFFFSCSLSFGGSCFPQNFIFRKLIHILPSFTRTTSYLQLLPPSLPPCGLSFAALLEEGRGARRQASTLPMDQPFHVTQFHCLIYPPQRPPPPSPPPPPLPPGTFPKVNNFVDIYDECTS